jgi:2-hydroxychromene-2-carboxylate isomerase
MCSDDEATVSLKKFAAEANTSTRTVRRYADRYGWPRVSNGQVPYNHLLTLREAKKRLKRQHDAFQFCSMRHALNNS